MNEESDIQLVDGDCEGEACTSCGEVHDAPSLDHVLKKQRWMYHGMKAGYFISLLVFAGCAYALVGIWGAIASASAFGIYFFHMNMVGLIRILMALEEMTGKGNAALGEGGGPPESGKPPEHTGLYL